MSTIITPWTLLKPPPGFAKPPHAGVSGGVSNVSFSFRGNNPVREAIHSVFLYHAIKAGMNMGIVNAGQLAIYDDLPEILRNRVEDVISNRNNQATEALLEIAEQFKDGAGDQIKQKRISPGDNYRSPSGLLTP